jgi:YbgC/YbaW family acyl-CoA thioester hydrolase
VHQTTIHVRWGELDPYHHVNHATYLSYLEHARISALESIGWGMDVLTAAGYQVVVVGIEVRFRRPASAGDTLVIESNVAHLGASESSWRQVIRRGDEVIAEATVHAAATNLAGRPVRAPKGLKEALGGLRHATN